MLDWLYREGGSVLSWWLLTTLAGIAVFPLTFRLLRGLPGRGYALARAAGIIVVAYLFWILNILHIMRNDSGDVILVTLAVFVVGVISYATWREREPIVPWLRAHLGLIVMTELVFAAALFSWATVRAINPNLTGTEKPMEIGFLAATRRSATFPPNDMWMSGYAISYYHFGYIMMAALANLSSVTNGTAFNLAAALLFALAATGAFGLGYELIAARQIEQPPEKRDPVWTPHVVGILAAVILTLMSNLGPALIEVPYQYKALPDSYFVFMDVHDRDFANNGCPQLGEMPPSCFYWWWPYSRVVRDRTLTDQPLEIIDEFPAFSYILSDVHPHVLSLPFVLLALGLMLNLVLLKRDPNGGELLLYTVCVGGLIFLNSWDGSFLALLIGAEALRRLIRGGTGGLARADWFGIVRFGATVGIGTGIFYLPFFISFRSQAGGFVPNVIWPTRPQQFFLMFGAFAIVLAWFVVVEAWRARGTFNVQFARNVILYAIAVIVVFLILLSAFAWVNSDWRQVVYNAFDASGGLFGVLPAVIGRRLGGAITEGFLLALIFGVLGRLFARAPHTAPDADARARRIITYSPVTGFVLLLVGAGAVLTLLPEFGILRDNFGSRINMVFKFYYQVWIVWSIAGAYAVWSILRDVAEFRVPAGVRIAFGTVSAILLAMGLIYTPLATYSRAVVDGGHANGGGAALTLDGGNSLAVGADDYTAIGCLNKLAKGDTGVVAEGMIVPMAYNNQYGRVSILTGIPTLLGWSNHEGQWRGTTYAEIAGTRAEDEATLYNAPDWTSATPIIQKYHITYIYIGPTELGLYKGNGGLDKFKALKPVCTSGEVTVYATDTIAASGVAAPANAGSSTGG